MPTYVYECSVCKTTFEAEQRIIEAPLTRCICGSEGTVKRLIQPIAVMFKGSGFHINDYAASTSAPKAEAAEGESATDTKKETSATPETAATPPPAAASEPTSAAKE